MEKCEDRESSRKDEVLVTPKKLFKTPDKTINKNKQNKSFRRKDQVQPQKKLFKLTHTKTKKKKKLLKRDDEEEPKMKTSEESPLSPPRQGPQSDIQGKLLDIQARMLDVHHSVIHRMLDAQANMF